MGNRSSIQVCSIKYLSHRNRDDEEIYAEWKSPMLYRHWGGDREQMIALVEKAFNLMEAGFRSGTEGYPSEVLSIITFISVLQIGTSSKLEDDENTSDNGHFTLLLGEPHKKELHWRLFNKEILWDNIDYKKDITMNDVGWDEEKLIWERKGVVTSDSRFEQRDQLLMDIAKSELRVEVL